MKKGRAHVAVATGSHLESSKPDSFILGVDSIINKASNVPYMTYMYALSLIPMIKDDQSISKFAFQVTSSESSDHPGEAFTAAVPIMCCASER